jgi:L-histidine Nalpha-methyltransferase
VPRPVRVEADARFALQTLAGSARPTFAEDVRSGLSASPKTLPPKYFYDELGSRLFEAICVLPEYYATRAETEILAAHAGEIAAAVGRPPARLMRLIELGSGDSRKTRHLLDALLAGHLAGQTELEYVPIDVAASVLERTAEDLLREYPGLSVAAYAADFWDALATLRTEPSPGRTLLVFLGSTIGNMAPEEQRSLFRAVRRVLAPGDAFLLGTDLRNPPEILIPAYDDPLGVTAAFDLNVLARINRELGGEFVLGDFRHLARYDSERHRIEMHLESRRDQRVRIGALAASFDFTRGETIFTESSYKFDPAQLARWGEELGLTRVETWYDARRRFGSHLFTAA